MSPFVICTIYANFCVALNGVSVENPGVVGAEITTRNDFMSAATNG